MAWYVHEAAPELNSGNCSGLPAADYIVAVDDAAEWHRQNLQKNGGTHYSFLRVLGARGLSRVQVVRAVLRASVPHLEGDQTKPHQSLAH